MRIVIIGASALGIKTAEGLIKEGHEVIIIESNPEIIEEFSEKLDCSFLKGDGTRPEILEETNPKQIDLLIAITNNDQSNIISSLVGKSIGFKKVVLSVKDAEWEAICNKLGLENAILPVRTMSQYLIDTISERDFFELKNFIHGDARLFSFTVTKENEKKVEEFSFPDNTQIVWYFRDEKFHIANSCDALKENDQVVVVTHQKHLEALRKKWNPPQKN